MRPLIDRVLSRPSSVLTLFLASIGCGWILGRAYIGFGSTVGMRATQYFFNYQDLGFVKRGLIGTLLHPFPILLTRAGIGAVCWFFLILFAFLFWRLFIGSTEAVAGSGRGVLALLCAAMPAFFLRLGFDYGRFDVLDLIAAVAAIGFLERSRRFAASIVCAAAILIHEDFILFQLPLLVLFYRPQAPSDSRAGRIWSWGVLLAPPMLAALAVGVWGRSRMGGDQLASYFAGNAAYLKATPDGRVNLEEISVISRTAWDNAALDVRMFFEKKALLHLPVILVWFWFIFRYASRFYRANGLARDATFVAALTPFLLGAIGFDYYRWVAMAAVNLVLLIVLQCREIAKSGRVPVVGWDLNAKILAASVLLGPISNTKSFPYLFLFLEKVSPWRISW